MEKMNHFLNSFLVQNIKFIIFFPAEGDINDVLIKTLAEAHANTNIKLEVVNEMFRKPQVAFYDCC